MDNSKLESKDASAVLDYWTRLPIEDIHSLKLSQKIDHTITELIDILVEISEYPIDNTSQYLSFVWSASVRDFAILLRDALLGVTKYEQFAKDNISLNMSSFDEIQTLIRRAATEVENEYTSRSNAVIDVKAWRHQESPISEIKDQLIELQKQSKKIFRSSSKIDDIRLNISDYVKDFQLQYSRQTNAVHQLFSIVDEVKDIVKSISSESDGGKINDAEDQIGENSQKLELIQGTESIDILPYSERETVSLPVSNTKGSLIFKSINIKSEFGRWFSSLVYPKIIELESKRDHAVETCLQAFSQVRTKIAAISFADKDDTVDLQREFEKIFLQLDNEVLKGLKKEEEETNALIVDHLNNQLKASNIYAKDILFLPETGTVQISDLSKDALKRIINRFERYRKEFWISFDKFFSKYIEVDRTPHSLFVKNKLEIYDKDESLSLFLKDGYLGKSFTIPRPNLINPILVDYNLWEDGFAGSILLSGLRGSGKSTILGMINHLGLNEEVIQLKTREFYFIKHRSYDPIIDLKVLIKQVVNQTKGRRVIICIDDLELWHDDQNELFDNINKLFDAIIKYRNRVFFVVTCSPFLKRRIEVFNELNSIFTIQREMGKMNANQIRTALNLRVRVNESVNFDESEMDSKFRNIIRESKGNVGYAMLEYCRINNESYKSNVKSQEFTELIHAHHSLLNYISSYNQCSIKALSISLSELDFEDTMKSIDRLVGQKILVRPKTGFVSINPLLIHTVEQSLIKSKK